MKKKDDMVTVQEAATLKGVSRARVHQWITDGRLQKEVRYGRTVVSLSEVMTLEELKRGPKAETDTPAKAGKKDRKK